MIDCKSTENIILHDDAIKIMNQMEKESVDLIVTDPPYRCISGGRAGKKNQPSGMLTKNDGKIFDYNDVEPSIFFPMMYRVLKSGKHCYVFCNVINLCNFIVEAEKAGFLLHSILVWQKNNATPSRWYMKNCEFILFLRKGKAKPINMPGSKQVMMVNNIIGKKTHPTEKPVALLEILVKNSSSNGDIVFDPFMGTGSTGVACKQTNRIFFGIEIDEKYFWIAKEKIMPEKLKSFLDSNPIKKNKYGIGKVIKNG